jgi:peroxiredoxin
MNTKLTIRIGIIISLLMVCENAFCQKSEKGLLQTKNASEHSIIGFAHGFSDSTWLYLESAIEPKGFLDSAMIIDNRFYFVIKKSLIANPKHFILRTKSYSDYKYFWMDDHPIIFSGVKGDFRKSLIGGSVSEQVNEAFERLTNPLLVLLDSLNRYYGTTDSVVRKKIIDLEQELKDKSAGFIEINNTSIVSAHLLKIYCKTWGLKTSTRLYNKLSPELKMGDFGKSVKRFIDLNKEVDIGSSYIDFEQKSATGELVRLSSTIGKKYLLLEFWASWCGPCRKENPELVSLYRKYQHKGFDVFGVSSDLNVAQWKKAILKDQLPWHNVSDLKGGENEAALIYGVWEIPTNFLIDPSGKIIAKNLRGADLKKKLRELFGE